MSSSHLLCQRTARPPTGLSILENPSCSNCFKLAASAMTRHSGSWTNAFGERRIVPDNYGEMKVDLKHQSGKLLQITFRAYNEGAAFRYGFPAQAAKEFKFSGERTEFRFPKDT